MPRTSEQYPFALKASIVAFSLVCLWGAFEFYQGESAYQRQNRDPFMISAQLGRLEPVLAIVPERAELGYLTDADAGSVMDTTLLLGAQYALAPRIVIRGAAREWVLGNFTRLADFAALGRTHGLRVEQDFGNGVVVFRKER